MLPVNSALPSTGVRGSGVFFQVGLVNISAGCIERSSRPCSTDEEKLKNCFVLPDENRLNGAWKVGELRLLQVKAARPKLFPWLVHGGSKRTNRCRKESHEALTDKGKAAGEFLLPSKALTGPASTGRLVCAPAAMTVFIISQTAFRIERRFRHGTT